MSDSPLRIAGYDWDAHLVDNIGRRQPTKLNSIWAFRAIPGLGRQFKQVVPSEFWSKDVDDRGLPLAIVACPCGQEPQLRPAGMKVCGCERMYLSLGTEIRVGNSPVTSPSSVKSGSSD